MKIIAVDDEESMLNILVREVTKVFPKEEIIPFQKGSEVLAYAKKLEKQKETIKYAFLDIELMGMTGIELAKQLKEIHPDMKIMFCTGYSQYAVESYKLHAIGYLMKPIHAEDIIETLKAMDTEWKEADSQHNAKARIQTFGNFEVFVNGRAMNFEREKAKEMLAYLVDRKGASVTMGELAAVLLENRNNDSTTKNYVHTIFSSLRKNLKEEGVEDILVKTFKHISIDTTKFDCDLYDMEQGDALALNSYHGEYMSNYSWAEYTNEFLMKKEM